MIIILGTIYLPVALREQDFSANKFLSPGGDNSETRTLCK